MAAKRQDRCNEAEHCRMDAVALDLADVGEGEHGIAEAGQEMMIRRLLHGLEVSGLGLGEDVVFRVGDSVKDPVMGLVVADVEVRVLREPCYRCVA